MRQRRISGRKQVTTDGRHIIDGVAFGRPYLKRLSRPSVDVQPNKRVKRTHDGEDEDGELESGLPSSSQELVLQSLPLDEGDEGFTSDSSDEDDEFRPFEDEDVAKELQLLAEEQNWGEASTDGQTNHADTLQQHRSHGSLSYSKPRRQTYGLGIGAGSTPGSQHESRVTRNRKNRTISEGDRRSVHRGRKGIREGARTLSAQHRSNLSEDDSRRSSRSSTKSVRFEQHEFETPATLREPELEDASDSSDDEDFVPENASISTESNKENITPLIKDTRQEYSSSETTSSSATPDADSESKTTSSSGSDTDSDSDETSSDGEEENPGSELEPSSDTSGSESTSTTSSSDKELGKTKSPDHATTREQKQNVKDTPSSVAKATQTPQSDRVPPGSGKPQTQRRNERRRWAEKLRKLKEAGELPEFATFNDCKEWHNKQANDTDHVETTEDLESRRQALLKAIDTGGVHVASERHLSSDLAAKDDCIAEDNTKRASHIDQSLAIQDKNVHMSDTAIDDKPGKVTSTPTRFQEPSAHPASEPTRRRATLDIAGSRRLLFGSLGLKAPKSKEEEESMRAKLMENIRPISKNPRLAVVSTHEEVPNAENQAWRDTIALKAVECCYNGTELSEPPFPFVQRWDQSQRGSYGHNGNGSKKRKKNDKDSMLDDEHAKEVSQQLEPTYSADSSIQAEPSQPTMEPTYEPEDLPEPPQDLSTLEDLQLSTAVAGSIIVFKHLELSAATNWQPVSSGYRTAKVIYASEDGDLELSLALRDRNRKDVDPTTGERLYTKFEMPGMDDDDGFLAISFDEMEDPRMLRDAVSATSVDDVEQVKLTTLPEAQTELLQSLQSNPAEDHEPAQSASASQACYIQGNDNATPEVHDVSQAQTDAGLTQSASVNQTYLQGNDNATLGIYDGSPAQTDAVLDNVRSSPIANGEVSEEVRDDISALIKDAGFHSDVASELRGYPKQPEASSERDYNDRYPEFDGFGSSPSELRSSLAVDDMHSNPDDDDAGTGGAIDESLPHSSPMPAMTGIEVDGANDQWRSQDIEDTIGGDLSSSSINRIPDDDEEQSAAAIATSPPEVSKQASQTAAQKDSADLSDVSVTPIKRPTRRSHIASIPISPPQKALRGQRVLPKHHPTSSLNGSDFSDDLPSFKTLLS